MKMNYYCWFELQQNTCRLLTSELVSFLAMSENLQMVLSMFFCVRNDVQVVQVSFSTSRILFHLVIVNRSIEFYRNFCRVLLTYTLYVHVHV